MNFDTRGDHSLKKYYTIGEVAQLFDVSTSLIRFWEKTFPSLQPQKNKQGARRYTQTDIRELSKIYQLVKKQGYTLQGAKDVIKSQQRQPRDKVAFTRTLNRLRAFLIHLKETSSDV